MKLNIISYIFKNKFNKYIKIKKINLIYINDIKDH